MNSTKVSNKSIQISFWAAIVFFILFVLVHFLKPEIDPSWRFISELAIGRFGWIMAVAFLALALSYATISAGLWSNVRLGGKIGLVFLFIGSVGLILAGLFTTQPINTKPEDFTPSSHLHGLGAILGTNGAGIGSLIVTIVFAFGKEKNSGLWLIIAALLLTVIGYIWFLMTMPADGIFGPQIAIGLPNRLLMLSYFLWLVVTSRYVINISGSNIERTVKSGNQI